VSNGWGTSDFGGAWTLAGAASLFSANGTAGQMRLASAGAGPMATLSGVSAVDVNGSVDIAMDKVPTGSGSQGIAYIRRVPGTGTTVSDYRIKLRLMPTSTSIQISRIVNNVETALVTQTMTGLTYQAGDVIRLSFQAKGTAPATISAKAWKVGTTEPTAWRATATDSNPALQGPGALGLQGYLSGSTTNAPVVASFDNLSITAATP
jgi:large repetitive protein